ncbi:MAG: hypothetical protein VYA74_04365 [Bacteroidota bacterium]|nr:hypothetical protein [Bacteroidota bacterium]
MAIRKINSRSIEDGSIATADIANNAVTTAKTSGLSAGVGFFIGENGATRGDATNGKGDIFRVNESTLNTSVTIASGDNASCAGPLEVSSSGTVNLTVLGNLTII